MKIILMFFFVCFSYNSYAESEYNFVKIKGLIEQDIGDILLRAVYESINIPITVLGVPAERAIVEARSGRADGETLRIFSYGERFKEMIRVPTPLYFLTTQAFTSKDILDKDMIRSNLNDYSILIIKGVQHAEALVANHKSTIRFSDNRSMFTFLSFGRADIGVTNGLNGEYFIKKDNVTNVRAVGDPLKYEPLYHYLHKKHESVVPKVNQAILDMIKSGELERLVKKAEYDALNI